MLHILRFLCTGQWPTQRKTNHQEYAAVALPQDSHYTHSLTHSHTHSSPTHSHTHSLIHPLTHLLTHSLTHSHTHSLTHPLTHTLTHSHTHTLTHSLTHTLTYHYLHILVHSLFLFPSGSWRREFPKIHSPAQNCWEIGLFLVSVNCNTIYGMLVHLQALKGMEDFVQYVKVCCAYLHTVCTVWVNGFSDTSGWFWEIQSS